MIFNIFYIPAAGAISFSYSNAEYEMMAKIIKSEAGSESLQGKIAVGNVVMNRVVRYNSTITSILTTPNQFAYNSGVTPTAECYEAARRVLENKEWVVPTNCHYFKNSGPPSNGYATWSGKKDDIRTFWGKIGGNYFFLRDEDGVGATGGRIKPQLYTFEYDTPRLGTKPSDEVIHIQKLLEILGYDVTADGYFGENTDISIKDFQEKYELKSDGIVGDETLEKIEEAVAEKSALEKKEARNEYLEKVQPDLEIVCKQKLIIEGTNNLIVKYIAGLALKEHLENLIGMNYPVKYIGIKEQGYSYLEEELYFNSFE